MSRLNNLKRWVKAGENRPARLLRKIYGTLRNFEIPSFPRLFRVLYGIHKMLAGVLDWIARVFYWTPMFQARLSRPAPRLYLYGGLPLVTGSLLVQVGRDCRISAATTFSGRWCSEPTPQLIIGDNVGIGWQTTISVGSRVVIGNNVRIAGRSFLSGHPGHPIDAEDRAAGLPDTADQVGDIVLENDVWLGTGVMVSAGVHIGAGTIVASGSVVTRDLPAAVLAGGVPARVIRPLTTVADRQALEVVV